MFTDAHDARRLGRLAIRRVLPEASGVLLSEIEAFDGMLTDPGRCLFDHLRIRVKGPEIDVRLATSGPLDFALGMWRDVSRPISIMRAAFLETAFVASFLLTDAVTFYWPETGWKALKVPLFDESWQGLNFAAGAIVEPDAEALSVLRWSRPPPANALDIDTDARFLSRVQERGFEIDWLCVPDVTEGGKS